MGENKKQSIWEAYKFSIILLGAIFIGSIVGIQMGEKATVFKPFGDLFINGMFMVVVPLVFVTISRLLGAIFIGSIVGIQMGEKATVFKPFGDLFINGMFMVVVPLVFVTISSSIAGMNDMKRLGKILKTMLITFVGTGMVAAVYVFITVKVFPPAEGVSLAMPAAEALKPFQTGDQIVAAITVTDFPELISRKNMLPLIPPAEGVSLAMPAAEALKPFQTGDQIVAAITVTDFPELISRKNMLPLIIFSIVFGICTNMIGEKGKVIARGLDALSEVFLKIVGLLMYYAPIGLGAYFAALIGEHGKELEKGKVIARGLDALSEVFLKIVGLLMYYAPIGLGAYFAALIGEHGKELLGSYARAMAVYYPLCLVYMFTAFPLYAWISGGMEGVRRLKYVVSPAVTAVATQSSIATLPVNLEACEKIFPLYAWISGGMEGVRRLKYVVSPAVTAVATQSSIATLPVNLEACEKIGVPKDIREIILPIGATAHMDGTVLSSILKISLVCLKI